jgi:hypothetical protein
VHYQLYNPLNVPSSANLPATPNGNTDADELRIGCRVINATTLDAKLKAAGLAKSQNPAFAQMAGPDLSIDGDFWTLHNFVADLVIGCKEGYIAGVNPMEDEGLFRVFNLRSGPISAAISISIDAPG